MEASAVRAAAYVPVVVSYWPRDTSQDLVVTLAGLVRPSAELVDGA